MNRETRGFTVLLVLAFAGGLALALARRDLAPVVEPAIGLLMAACGLFLMFGRPFAEPAPPDVERVFRRRHRDFGAGMVLFGVSQLLPMGWWRGTGLLLAGIIMLGSHFVTRREMAALASRPQGRQAT